MNGDGKSDIVAVSNLSNYVWVFLGNGNGTFQPPTTNASGKSPMGVAMADFNCDGLLDVATANYNGNSASILAGNGDGKPDLAVSNNFSKNVTVLLNTTACSAP
jgi:FG-GAP-like repeat